MQIAKRLTIEDIFAAKRATIEDIERMLAIKSGVDERMKTINGFSPVEIERSYRSDDYRKDIDRCCWSYLVSINQLEGYMLCTDHDKLLKQIERYQTPEFTVETATAWMDGLRDLIYDNVKKLAETVFDRLTDSEYYTGREKKKRNNNGIDKTFIITTTDYYDIFSYNGRISVTDDLEKLCYIIDGEKLPEVRLKQRMRAGKLGEAENKYFRIWACKNCNTHYTFLDDSIRQKINLVGSRRGVIGEDIKIKVFRN